ncbi:unnamed protein product [Gongylonema pulchrum]|uniref:Uncharacterized protein n=1 Tax=Gongylonema pulchrum TaxID=637853 RepID=A0A3P7NNB0_9BILA|nr:unnamed protein product [Gongylonema pulchrum]
MLTEQRNQTSFFVAALLPVLNNQLGLLDESSHVRQVTEHLHGAVRTSKSTAIIDTILNDIHQGSDHSWRSCLSSNANRSSCIYGTAGDDISVRTSSPTPSTCTWPASVDAVNSRTYTPPSPSQPFTFALKKPPLPKRTITATNSVVGTVPDFSGSSDEQTFKRNGSLLSCSSTDISSETTVRRPSRPLSFACEDVVTARPNGTPPTVRNGPVNNGTCTANDGSCKPPPPPERRNSTITAATPTAPSVAEIRAAGGTTAASSEYASSIASSSEFSRDQFTMRYV